MPANYFETPIYTVAQVARIVGVPKSTLAEWTKFGLITRAKKVNHGEPSVPFIGLAEAYVLAAFRRQSKISMQFIKKAMNTLKNEYKQEHPLASNKLLIEGAEIFFRLAESAPKEDEKEIRRLVRLKNNQTVFADTVEMFLKQIEYSDSGLAEVIKLQGYKFEVVVDPRRSYGMPVINRAGVRVSDIVGQLKVEDDWQNISEGYGVTIEEISEIARVDLNAA